MGGYQLGYVCDENMEANGSSHHRVSSTSAATARSSDSRTASRSPSSCNERTPAVSPGPSSTADSTARVSLRYASTKQRECSGRSAAPPLPFRYPVAGLTHTTGGCQEANPPCRQGPARHCRCLPRRDQGEAQHPTRGPLRCPRPGHQGEQGEEAGRRCRQEG